MEKLKILTQKIKKPLILLVSIIFLVGLFYLGTNLIFKKDINPVSPVKFAFGASIGNSRDVLKNSKFILKSSSDISEKKLEKLIIFNPKIDFKVKKKNKFISLIHSALANNNNNNNNLENKYEIIPNKDLEDNKLYKVEIATSTELIFDHKYSWAFQIKALFQVSEAFPADKSTDVPLNTGIEITFNRDKIADFENHFSIEPEIKGKIEKKFDKIVFIPENDLKEKTIYKITVKKELGRENSNEKTSEDYVFQFETASKYGVVAVDYLNWNSDYFEINSDKSILQVYGDNKSSEVEVIIYKYENGEKFIKSYIDRDQENSWTSFNKPEYEPKNVEKVLSFKPQIIDNPNDYQKLIELPKKLGDGYYLFEIKVNNIKDFAWGQVSPVAYYYSLMNGHGLIWAQDFPKKSPLINAKLSFVGQGEDNQFLGKTNDQGLTQFNTPEKLKYNDATSTPTPQYFKLEKDGFNPYFIPSNDTNIEKTNKYFSYLTTDRPAYQLSDKIHFWGVVRGREIDLKEKKLNIGLYKRGEENQITSAEIIVSPFDTIEGEINYQGVAPDTYEIRAKYNDDVVANAFVEALSFTKPLYKLSVETEKNNYWVGDIVNFKIKAEFFDKTPVAGIKLAYEGDWGENDISGEINLDENGEATLSYKPEYFFHDDEYSSTNYPQNLVFRFNPAMSEEGNISAWHNVNVFGPDLYIQSFSKKKSKDVYEFKATLNKINLDNNDYIGESKINYPLSAEIIKYYYVQIDDGEYYDPINKVKIKKYRYEQKKENITIINGATNEKGEWIFNQELKNVDNGFYKIIFTGKDEKNRILKSSVYGGYDYYPGNNMSLGLRDLDEKELVDGHKVGDKINLEAYTEGKGKPFNNNILLYRFQNDIIEASVKDSYEFKSQFTDDYIPSMSYIGVILGPNGFIESNSLTLSFNENQKKLDISINPEKDKYRPKENIKFNLEVKDKEKNKVKANVNLSVVDEALFHVLDYDYSRDILYSLYSDISSYPITRSTYFILPTMMEAEKGGCFIGETKIAMADGSEKLIKDIRVGDEVLTFINETNIQKVKAIVQGISKHNVQGYLSINDRLFLTPEHKIFLNGKWDSAGNAKVGDELVEKTGQKVKIKKIEKNSIKDIPVYNIIVDKYHTYFASDIYVHNAEKGGGVRSEFVDVPMFKSVETDADGKASAEFIAPDNLTSWRVTATAFEPKNIQAGSEFKLIPVGLPLFGDITLNKFYLANDNPTVRIRVFGSEYKKDQPVEFSLKSNELGIDKKIITTSTSVDFSLGELKKGNYKLIASVKQGNNFDALERKFDVLENYFRKASISKYEIKNNNNLDIKGNNNGFTNLLFVDSGKGKFYNDISNLSYGFGIRSDQIVASYIAEKMLKENFKWAGETSDLDLNAYFKDGISLFPYSEANLELSAKITDLIPDKIIKNQIKEYFYTALSDAKSDIHRLPRALYGLASLNELVLDKIDYIKNEPSLDLEDKIYLSLALYKIGDGEGSRAIYENEIRNNLIEDDDQLFIKLDNTDKAIKATAMLGLLASYLDEKNDFKKIWNFISVNNPEEDLIVLEKAMIINNEITKENINDAFLTYKTNINSGNIDLSNNQTFSMYLSENDLKSISFSNIKGSPMVISYYEESVDPNILKKSNNISVSKKFVINKNEVDEINEGELVKIKFDVNFKENALDGGYQLIDYLPSGLKPVAKSYFSNSTLNEHCDRILDPTQIIDNAVYFDIWKGFEKTEKCKHETLSYYARVVNKGNFRSQPAIIQSLKNPEILNISEEKRLIIK